MGTPMAAAAASSSSKIFPSPSSSDQCRLSIINSHFALPFSLNFKKPTTLRRRTLSLSFCAVPPCSPGEAQTSFGPDEPRKGIDILVKALVRQGVDVIFTYVGDASLGVHQALKRSAMIRRVIPCPGYGAGSHFAFGYALSSKRPGVYIAASSAGATNLASGLKDARIHQVPIVVITCQMPQSIFDMNETQKMQFMGMTGWMAKSRYLVSEPEHKPRVIEAAFFRATSGQPGPVLVHVPLDMQPQLAVPNWNRPMKVPGYLSHMQNPPDNAHLEHIVRLISESKKPLLRVGGGCLNSSDELNRFVELTGIPVVSSPIVHYPMPYTCDYELSLQGLGKQEPVYAKYVMGKSDLLLVFGTQINDRVLGEVEAFPSQAKIVHIDADSVETGKNTPHVSICGDVKLALEKMNKILESRVDELKLDFTLWQDELKELKKK